MAKGLVGTWAETRRWGPQGRLGPLSARLVWLGSDPRWGKTGEKQPRALPHHHPWLLTQSGWEQPMTQLGLGTGTPGLGSLGTALLPPPPPQAFCLLCTLPHGLCPGRSHPGMPSLYSPDLLVRFQPHSPPFRRSSLTPDCGSGAPSLTTAAGLSYFSVFCLYPHTPPLGAHRQGPTYPLVPALCTACSSINTD